MARQRLRPDRINEKRFDTGSQPCVRAVAGSAANNVLRWSGFVLGVIIQLLDLDRLSLDHRRNHRRRGSPVLRPSTRRHAEENFDVKAATVLVRCRTYGGLRRNHATRLVQLGWAQA